MNLSKSGETFLKKEEGLRLKVYDDIAKNPTIGWGHMITPADGDMTEISIEEAQMLFDNDVSDAIQAIEDYVVVNLNQNQIDALVSFIFNVGKKAFSGSTLLTKLNNGDMIGAANEFGRWRKSGGKVSTALVARRARERELFVTGI